MSVRNILVAVGFVLTAVGIYLGGPADVFRKAISVCLECIGVG